MAMGDDEAPRADYDEAWKELLDEHLDQILGCFFPVVHAAVDWGRGIEWLDQELREMFPDSDVRTFRVDRLVKVRRTDGGEQWLLIHLEVQSFRESGFAERIYHYNHGIHRAWGRQPVSLVILADLEEGWKPEEYVHEELGCVTRFRFVRCKLLEEMERLEDDYRLPAVAAKAQIGALRTVGDPERRFEIRWRILRALYEHGFSAAEVRAAYRILSWMMRLPRDMQLTFRERVVEWERSKTMPYITDIEELAEERGIERGMESGIERGMERGVAEVALAQLERACGDLGSARRERVAALPLPRLRQLSLDLLEFRCAEDLDRWLAARG